MSRHRITYGAASTVLRREIPTGYGASATQVVEITDTAGNALLASTGATVYAGDTLASAMTRGAKTATVTTGTALVKGDHVRISGDGFTQDFETESYVTATKVVTFKERSLYAFPASSPVAGRYATYDLDASTTTTFTHLLKFTVRWTWNATDPELIDYGQIVKTEWHARDLEETFSKEYQRFYDMIGQDRFESFAESSRASLDLLFRGWGKDIDTLVDMYSGFDTVLCLQIAQQIAGRGDDTWAGEFERITTLLNMELEKVKQLPMWTDSDEDGIKEDDEVSPPAPWPQRRWP